MCRVSRSAPTDACTFVAQVFLRGNSTDLQQLEGRLPRGFFLRTEDDDVASLVRHRFVPTDVREWECASNIAVNAPCYITHETLVAGFSPAHMYKILPHPTCMFAMSVQALPGNTPSSVQLCMITLSTALSLPANVFTVSISLWPA